MNDGLFGVLVIALALAFAFLGSFGYGDRIVGVLGFVDWCLSSS